MILASKQSPENGSPGPSSVVLQLRDEPISARTWRPLKTQLELRSPF
ncbi:MAG: hypothetical protein AAF585_10720 [Verrucomicrobiota bacterium]